MITLSPMDSADYTTWYQRSLQEYAAEYVRNGQMTEKEAIELATKQFEDLLSQGLDTPDQYLYSIKNRETGEIVGMAWLAIKHQQDSCHAFVYNIEVNPQHRRHGYATQTMYALEEKARELGATQIALHVFGYNTNAFDMYIKVGYHVTNYRMAKDLA